MQAYVSIYSFLWQIIKPYKWQYTLMMLFAPLATAVYELANRYALKLVVDAFSGIGLIKIADLIFPIGLYISITIFQDLAWRISNIAEWQVVPYVKRNIILASYDYVQHHSYKFFQDTFSGSVVSKLKGIVDGYEDLSENMQQHLLPNLFSVLVLTSSLAFVSLDVFVFVLIWSIAFFAVMYKMSIRLDRISVTETESKHQIMSLISDNITNMFSLFSFANRQQELHKIDQFIASDFIPKQKRTFKYDFKLSTVMSLFYWVLLISVFMFMIYVRTENKISGGDFVFVMTTVLGLSWNQYYVVQNLRACIKQLGDFKSSFEILMRPHIAVDAIDTSELQVKRPEIQFKNVSFAYNKQKVFTKLNLNISSGEKIGLVGTSGAGKSTLLSLLLKYFKVDGGQILIDGQDLNNVTADSIRQSIAIIPQDIMLFHRTILENIKYGKFDAENNEIVYAAKKANIHKLVESLPDKYSTIVGERGVKLSMGQRQRIAIARAILKNAPILILDEATSSLDTRTEQLIQNSISKMLSNRNTTVIAIAHRLSTLKHMDRIVVLDKGQIIEEGSHKELISYDSAYKKLWDIQKV